MDPTESKKLALGPTRGAGGVCSGLSKYYGISKGGVQAGFVIGSLFFVGQLSDTSAFGMFYLKKANVVINYC
jgi:phage shock protein PspC (stress-responsive transcriptional regulator)